MQEKKKLQELIKMEKKLQKTYPTDSKGDLIEYKCLCCKKNYQKKFDEAEGVATRCLSSWIYE